jgi:DNA adenine methylase
MNNRADVIFLNDLNKAIYSFWFSVLYECDSLCELIANADVTMDEWHKQKEIISSSHSKSVLELGFATFFLNRTNRSGILKGGVIGGKNQSGNWKLDARFNKIDLVNRILKINSKRDSIILSNLDAQDFLTQLSTQLGNNSLIYLDPPYYIKGKGLYENHYKHDDHLNISTFVQNTINVPWIVSYDNVPQINEMYKNCPQITYGINYSAQDRYLGSEVMFFSNELNYPQAFK